jgi:hypothetical protein
MEPDIVVEKFELTAFGRLLRGVLLDAPAGDGGKETWAIGKHRARSGGLLFVDTVVAQNILSRGRLAV